MVRDTPPSQDVSTHQIWKSYLKEYKRYGPDTKAGRTHGRIHGRTVRLLYASQSSFGGIKRVPTLYVSDHKQRSYWSSNHVSKGAKIRNRYNQVQNLTQDTNGKVTNSQLDTTNESQELSLFPAGDHKAHINRRLQRRSKHKTEKTEKIHKRSTA